MPHAKTSLPVDKFIELYGEGKTLQEIGDEYGITRERVRQLLNRNFKEEYNELKAQRIAENAIREAEKKRAKVIIQVCRVCGDGFEGNKTHRSFCSREHHDLWVAHYVKIVYHERLRGYQRKCAPEAYGKEQRRFYLYGETLNWAMLAYDKGWPVFDEFPQPYKDYTIKRFLDD
jgi:hypothetical protein